ncbi:MAG: hypothetical protein Q7S31_01405 [bacterium]|nr:hypothetical protein [bacterium]
METGELPQVVMSQTGEKKIQGRLKPTEISPVSDISHFERHWQPGSLGSEFQPNHFFTDAKSLTASLEEVARAVVLPAEYDRPHIVTLEYPEPIGQVGIDVIQPGEKVTREIRDQGKRGQIEVQVVARPQKPLTKLVTFEVSPVFPSKGQPGGIKFQLRSAFPGEPAPSLFSSKDEDKEYWRTHAFVKLP